MGWIGVATIVAATCFLLYRHPPASWFSESSNSRAPREWASEKETPSTHTPDDSEAVARVKSNSQPLTEENGGVEESQITPKSSPSNVPLLEVPSFQLDADKCDKIAPRTEQLNLSQTSNESMKPPPVVLASANNMAKDTLTPSLQPPSTTGSSSMPPPPSRLRPTQKQLQPQAGPSALISGRYPPQQSGRTGGNSNSTLSPPPSAAASLRVQPNSRPTSSSTLAPTPLILKPSKKSSQRPVLEPGFSPLDWAALTSNPNNKLRGANIPPTLIRVTPSMLKAQNGRKGTDAWTSYQGKVYNITPYIPFHPGGKGELLRGAGKDSAKLFLEIHPWVNWDAILGECLVGILVSENDDMTENKLDAMD